jgi:hypothetical protein
LISDYIARKLKINFCGSGSSVEEEKIKLLESLNMLDALSLKEGEFHR